MCTFDPHWQIEEWQAVLELTPRQARRLMIGAQLLSGPPPKRPTRRKMREVIRQLGVVQIDSISVVERSHHIVLWSRLGNHPTEWLYELHSDERAVFEYWAHACAYVPIELFGPFRRQMLSYPDAFRPNSREWVEENREVLDHVLDFVQRNGAVSTRSFDPPEGARKAEPWAWYGNKPTNIALDMLWTMGHLMIDRREGFQRLYDLTERIYPCWEDELHLPPEDEARETLAANAARAMGITNARWLPDYYRSGWQAALPRATVDQLLQRLVERELVVPAKIRGMDGEFFVWKDLIDARLRPSRTTLLSPFDSLIWDRRRARELFDYDVKFEVYVPRSKRRYGYYNLAILHRDQLVGQLDPKVDRKAKVLTINSLHLEPPFIGKDDDRFYTELAATLHDFRAFNKADDVVVERSDPEEAAGRLRAALIS